MKFKKILIAYDGSDLSKKALDYAISDAKDNPEAELELVYVMEIPINYNLRMPLFNEVEVAVKEESQKLLDRAENRLKELPNKTKVTLLRGASPSREMLEHLKKGNYDLLIIGSRGLSGVGEFLGSVSHMIVQKSQIPVLVIK